MQVEVIDAYGNKSLRQSFYFYLIELTLTSEATPIAKVNKSDAEIYRYPCKPQGGTGLDNLYIELSLSPLDNPLLVLHSEQRKISNVNTTYNFQIKFDEMKDEEGKDLISHGVYLLNAKFCGIVPSSGEIISSKEHFV